MQFPVPQFTDVEDKIIGPLTIKQFGILFGAGILVFLPYSATKSVPVLVAFGILLGLPALVFAFGKLNGRPMYQAFGYFVRFLKSPKILVFHKEVVSASLAVQTKPEKVELAKQVAVEKLQTPKARLEEVQRLLKNKAREEEELLGRIK